MALAAVPVAFAGWYAFGRALARRTVDSRPLDGGEHARLQRAYDDAGVPVADTVLATDVEKRTAALGGTPRNRLFVLSETTLETTTPDELDGLIGIAAGRHEVRFPELFAGFLVAVGLDFAVALGVDPSGFESTLSPLLLVAVLVSVPVVGFALLRHGTYAADSAAVRRVGREPVRAALDSVEPRRLPDWVPDAARPKPSPGERLERL